jgi:hypothetical protein
MKLYFHDCKEAKRKIIELIESSTDSPLDIHLGRLRPGHEFQFFIDFTDLGKRAEEKRAEEEKRRKDNGIL